MSVPNFKSLEEFKKYNLSFIKGEIKSTFYHRGPLTEDQTPDKLLKLNECDFLTVNGQGPVNENGHNQRSYIMGYLPRHKSENIIKNIGDLFYFVEDKNYNPKTNITENILPLTIYNNDPCTTFVLDWSSYPFQEFHWYSEINLDCLKENDYVFMLVAGHFDNCRVEDAILSQGTF